MENGGYTVPNAVTQDKKEYMAYSDNGGGNWNFSYGVCHRLTSSQWNDKIVGYYADEGINIKDPQYTQSSGRLPVEIVDRVFIKVAEEFRTTVKNSLTSMNINVSEQQLDALSAIAYQWGWNKEMQDTFKAAYDSGNLQSWTTSRGQPFITGKTKYADGSPLNSTGEPKRADANWRVFNEGVYTTRTGSVLDPNKYMGNGDLLGKAREIHTYMEVNKYTYSQGNLAATFEASKTGAHVTCCATYVSWVLYEIGYTEFKGVNGCGAMDTKLRALGAQEIKAESQLQPGDICFRGTAHVQIYAGGSMWYNAGSTDAIQIAPENRQYFPMSGFTHALRLNKI